jgi:hypothetical protein
MTDPPTSKPELLALIRERWDVLQDLLSRLNDEELERPLGDGWSAKSHIAHLDAWEVSLTSLLRKQDRGAAMELPPGMWERHDLEEINAFIAKRAEGQRLRDVRDSALSTHTDVMQLLDSLTQEDLEKSYSHYQPFDPEPNPAPVAGWVHGNTWDHYNEHIGWLEAGLRA